MSTDMNLAVLEAIKEHLPSQTCSIVSDRLKQADNLERDNAVMVDEIGRLTVNEQKAIQREQELLDRLSKHAELDERELEIEAKVRDLTTQMLNQKIELMEKYELKMNEHTALLLRNTEFRRDYFEKVRDIHTDDRTQTNGGVSTHHTEHTQPVHDNRTAV